jgi:simple sugar transport system substrate-binding protein
MKVFRRVLVGLFAAAGLALAAGTAQAKDLTIIMVTHGEASDPFWAAVKKGADDAGKAMHAKVLYRAPETFDMVKMAQLIRAATNQRPDGLVVSIPDADALGSAIKGAVASGIPVISMNSGVDVASKLGVLLHVGQPEYNAGKTAGQKLAQMGGTKGICFNQEVGNVALDERCKGFADGFGHPVKVLPTTLDPSTTQAKVRGTLQSDPSVNTFLTLEAPGVGEPVVAAVKAMGLTKPPLIASFDLSPGFLKAVADGQAAFAIDQQPYLQGYLPVMFLSMYARYGLIPETPVIASGPNLITKDKASQVIKLSGESVR